MKILVIQQKMIGDVLTSTLLCESLKKKYPLAKIHYLVNTNTIPVVLQNPFIDEIIEFTDAYRNSKLELYKFLKFIRRQKYTWVIDAYGKLESNLTTLFSGAHRKTSYSKWYTSFIYNEHSIRKITPITNAGLAIENRLRLLFKENEIERNIIAPKIFLGQKEIDNAKNYLQSQQVDFNTPILMIGALGSEKRKTLPAAYMAKVLDKLTELKQGTILYNYIPSQLEEAQEIYNHCSALTQSNTRFDVFGKSLREFLAIMHHCTLLIGNEGGAVNMAKALGKPTFTIFSPWIPQHGWNLFEDGIKHKSVHLEQFRPDLFKNQTPNDLKTKALELYKQFTPELILPVFENYMKNYA